MKIAIAGAGDLARYLTEELLRASHQVVVLSRREVAWFKDREGVSLRITGFSSVPSLAKQIEDCEGLISVICDYSMNSATVHLALLEACRQSPKCKRFIPSEHAGNLDDFPEEPAFYFANHEPVRNALREQTDVMWTLFNLGWLTDYLVPARLRYLKDIGEFHPVDLIEKTFTIPGTGDEPIAFTSARDGARAVVRLFYHHEWEPITYVCGETTTWNNVKDIFVRRGKGLQTSYRSRELIVKVIADARSEEKVLAAQYDMWSICGAALLPQEKLERQRAKYFDGLKFRTVEEFLDEADHAEDTATEAL